MAKFPIYFVTCLINLLPKCASLCLHLTFYFLYHYAQNVHRHFMWLISSCVASLLFGTMRAWRELCKSSLGRVDKVANCAKNCGYKVLRAFCSPPPLSVSLCSIVLLVMFLSLSFCVYRACCVAPAGCQIVIYTTTEA